MTGASVTVRRPGPGAWLETETMKLCFGAAQITLISLHSQEEIFPQNLAMRASVFCCLCRR